MKRFFVIGWIVGAVFAAQVAPAKLTPEQLGKLPAPASHQVSFSNEVRPIFEASCLKCHARGRSKGGFRIDSRETLLKGGDSGPAVVPGKGAESFLIELVSGLDPDNTMPKKGKKLTAEQVGLLRAWIDQGASWDAQISFAKPAPKNLFPNKPEIPKSARVKNPVDAFLESYFRTNHFSNPRPVEDRIFARRAYLDVIGLLPSPEELNAFANDRSADKRVRLVRKLLADNQHYAEHWLSFWNDLLRNDYRGTGYIDGGRKQISSWLFKALYNNMPYDKFVAELINPTPESEGFSKGIVWRGVVNASQTAQMQAAQNIPQVFMGVNLKCASCHDSFVNDWTLADAYGLANIYSDEPLQIFQCDKPTGKMAETKFIYPELGTVDPKAKKPERLKQLADAITSKKDGRLSRTIVNRLWAKFFGRGLVEPLDDMEQLAWNQPLLDWLAEDLAEHGYDLKRTIEQMLTSEAYELPAVSASEGEAKQFVFNGPLIRRMSAEQFRDALGEITGVWFQQPAGEFDFSVLNNAQQRPETFLRAKWIWNVADAQQKAMPGTVYFRKSIPLASVPAEAMAVITCDNSFTLYLNGAKISSGKDFGKPSLVDILPHLKSGDNVFAISAVNNMPDNKAPSTEKPIPVSAANPAGLYVQIQLRFGGELRTFGSDASWVCSTNKTEGWETASFDSKDWHPASELGPAEMDPWKLAGNLKHVLGALALKGRTRSAMVAADPLMLGLGRPNREQVLTSRATAATTLQALELTNGETLAKLLKTASEKIVASKDASPEHVVPDLFKKALGRAPTPSELNLSKEVVGKPVQREGVEDLLWALAMLPEFQLIY